MNTVIMIGCLVYVAIMLIAYKSATWYVDEEDQANIKKILEEAAYCGLEEEVKQDAEKAIKAGENPLSAYMNAFNDWVK